MPRMLSRLMTAVLMLLASALPALAAEGNKIAAPPPPHTFVVQANHLELDGRPFTIVSGELHYERIPREYWRARLKMARAMGLNTIATYVFWNVHEPAPGVYNFSGNADIAEFIREAQQEGLWVMLRVGPYSCAEWEFGGFPAWLLHDPKAGAVLRSKDPAFLVPAERWLTRLAQEVGPLQIGRGGPVIAAQIENEYGNFGSDAVYMEQLHQIFLSAGFTDSLLYTANPSRTIEKGSIPGVFASVNFGIGHADVGLKALADLRPNAPLFAAEYWPGWFDHWGEPHQTRAVEQQLSDIQYILSHSSGINIYMFHGGTSFGQMAGSSWIDNKFLPDVTSYDYDAPLDEAGRPTPKFFAYRDAIAKVTGVTPPPVPPAPASMAVAPFTLTESVSLWDGLPPAILSDLPKHMEEIGQSYGLILYRKNITGPVHGDLVLEGLNDYALIYLNGRFLGALDRTFKQEGLTINTDEPSARLDILVENSGRINSTREIRHESKGISGATLAAQPLHGWNIYPLPIAPDSIFDPIGLPREARFGSAPASTTAPAFYRGSFTLPQPSAGAQNAPLPDTFLDIADLGKGSVWLNGHPLGRVWNVGPQRTLYLPGVWLHPGKNEVVVLDLLRRDHPPKLAGLASPILDAPTRQSTAAPDENVGLNGKP